jgi:hypothetical protein
MTEPPSRINGSAFCTVKQRCPGIEVEGEIEVLFGDLAQLFGLNPARVRDDDVQRALFLEHRREQLVQVGALGGIGGNGGHAVADQRFGLVQLALAAPGDEDVGAFFDEPRRGCQPDTATAAGDHGDLAVQS